MSCQPLAATDLGLEERPVTVHLLTRAALGRDQSPDLPTWMREVLDRLDHGVVMLDEQGCVAFANAAAHRLMSKGEAITAERGRLRACCAHQSSAFEAALAIASQKGLCRLVHLGPAERSLYAAVIPIPGDQSRHRIVLFLGRTKLGDDLAVQWFAQWHGLTGAETSVLRGLCDGLDPQAIAQRQGVLLTTIRTQVSSIRAKTSTASIRELLSLVAQLPPMPTLVALLRSP